MQPKLDNVHIMQPIPSALGMTFGDFVVGVFDAWSESHAGKIVWLALEVRLVIFEPKEE